MKVPIFDPSTTRKALLRFPDVAAQENLKPPELNRVFVPSGHQKALSFDSSVVIGMRGAGKSLWTAVLSDDSHRNFVAGLSNNPSLQKAMVRVGFGLDASNQLFPNSDVLKCALAEKIDPLAIWNAVVLQHALDSSGSAHEFRKMDWLQRLKWVTQNPLLANDLLTQCDSQFAAQGKMLLILFDALDQTSKDNNWAQVRLLTTGALRLALACRMRRSIRLKLFLRPDMEEDAEIWKFPDSSKLKHTKIELNWRKVDLYSLVLTRLANDGDIGNAIRENIKKMSGLELNFHQGVFSIPRELITDEEKLKKLVNDIAGPWMGKNAKRGYTYTWIPTHLADAAGRVSPRSFLLALKRAAEVTAETYQDHVFALHYKAVQEGVAHASKIRVDEIKEDYPWAEPLLEAARNLSVPCSPGELIKRWNPTQINQMRGEATRKLPPRRFTTDPNRQGQTDVLIDDLVELAIFYRTEDGRLNMPDIFRIEFGIKRKGGVKPPK